MMNIDWQTIFVPSVPVLETVMRGTVMYLLLCDVGLAKIGSRSIILS